MKSYHHLFTLFLALTTVATQSLSAVGCPSCKLRTESHKDTCAVYFEDTPYYRESRSRFNPRDEQPNEWVNGNQGPFYNNRGDSRPATDNDQDSDKQEDAQPTAPRSTRLQQSRIRQTRLQQQQQTPRYQRTQPDNRG